LFVCLFNSYFFVWYFLFIESKKKRIGSLVGNRLRKRSPNSRTRKKSDYEIILKSLRFFSFFVINYFP
jgi:tRNA(Glu) U13 pseudouridine synthase TruD